MRQRVLVGTHVGGFPTTLICRWWCWHLLSALKVCKNGVHAPCAFFAGNICPGLRSSWTRLVFFVPVFKAMNGPASSVRLACIAGSGIGVDTDFFLFLWQTHRHTQWAPWSSWIRMPSTRSDSSRLPWTSMRQRVCRKSLRPISAQRYWLPSISNVPQLLLTPQSSKLLWAGS